MPRASRHSDAIRVRHDRYYGDDPARLAALDQARFSDRIARQIYALRTDAHLTQRQLATLVGTTASVICQLEDADYSGHSLSMLRRIAAALSSRIEVRFVPVTKPRRSKTPGQRRKAG